MANHELVVFKADPDHRDLRAAIGIEGRQMGLRSRPNEGANGFWYLHRLLLSSLDPFYEFINKPAFRYPRVCEVAWCQSTCEVLGNTLGDKNRQTSWKNG